MQIGIAPCTGMGKALGSVSRYAAHYLAEKIDGEIIDIVKISAKDKEKLALLNRPIIVFTGCTENCAQKIIEKANGKVVSNIKLWKILTRQTAPDSREDIGEKGKELAKEAAAKALEEIKAHK